MARKVPQLHTMPWPAFVGTSLLVHIGVLSFGLPRVITVERPSDSLNHIPITLIDTEASKAGSKLPQLASSPSPPKAAPQTTAPNSDQNIVTETPPQTSPQQSAQPSPLKTDNSILESPSPEPASSTQPETNQPKLDSPAASPETSSEMENQPTSEPPSVADTDTAEQSDGKTQGATAVTIKSVRLTLQNQPKPNFQWPIQLQIPREHTCPRGTIPSDIELFVEVQGNGQVISLRDLKGNLYSQSAEVVTADCLFMVALQANPATISFAAPQTDTPFNDIEGTANPSAEVQLKLSFH
ncbi:MAG: hypothetical protein AAF821_14225 [Cyanobacteria bacterium P01_D01_bin.156]